jgi:hypothetical protein
MVASRGSPPLAKARLRVQNQKIWFVHRSDAGKIEINGYLPSDQKESSRLLWPALVNVVLEVSCRLNLSAAICGIFARQTNGDIK